MAYRSPVDGGGRRGKAPLKIFRRNRKKRRRKKIFSAIGRKQKIIAQWGGEGKKKNLNFSNTHREKEREKKKVCFIIQDASKEKSANAF